MQENYLAKWLTNELTEAELAEFKKTEAYATYAKIKETSQGLKAPEFNMDDAWTAIETRTQQTPKVVVMKPFRGFLKVAAVVALLVVGSYFYLNNLEASFSTGYAEQKTVVLPDASEIILNSESELAYDKNNWDKQRNVSLLGEAFFKVAKGKKFSVVTAHGTVQVLGTQFNVENRNNFFEVSCFEGLVSVLFNGKQTQIPAGNSMTVIQGKLVTSSVAVNGVPSWLMNESSFNSVPLQFVLDEFQRQFNVEVSAENIHKEQLFTGSFNHDDIHVALKSISIPLKLKYKLEDDKVLFYEEF